MLEHPTTCLNCGGEPTPGSPLGLCSRCLTERLLDPICLCEEGSPEEMLPDHSSHYELGAELARGGMGNILRATDSTLGRTVAMKVMLPEPAPSAEARQRFAREAMVLARLDHPNIVPIHELGRDEHGQLFYTMKLVQGETLQDIINRLAQGDAPTSREYKLDRLLTIFLKVCDALAFAHSRGIIHRDLKPENIMVGRFGEVLVMDWGLAKFVGRNESEPSQPPNSSGAKALDGKLARKIKGWSDPKFRQVSTDVTLNGAVVGTPRYMSPEQARGLVDQLDQRSDVFSLGGILYSILTLRPPVEGKTLEEILTNLARGNIHPPSCLTQRRSQSGEEQVPGGNASATTFSPFSALPHCPGGRMPAALSAVAMRALARKPGDRYQNVGALAADIEAYQGGFATSVENVGALGQFWLWVKRHRTISISAALIVVLSAGFLIKVVASERRARWEASNARTAERSARQAEAQALREQEQTREALAKSQIALAEAAYLEGDVVLLHQRLASCPEDLRDSTWHYLDAKRAGLASFTPGGDMFFDVLYRPATQTTGAEFILGDNAGELCFVDCREGVVRRRISTGMAGTSYLSISRDGRLVGVSHAGSGKVRVFDAESGDVRHEFQLAKQKLAYAYLSSDGRHLLVEHRAPHGFFMMDVQTQEKLWSQELGGHVYFDPLGRFVVHHHMNTEQDLWLLDPRDGSRIRRMEPGHSFVWDIGFSPDGRFMAAGDIFGYASVWEVATGRLKQRVKAGNGDVTGVKFTRENHLVTLSSEAEERGGQRRLRLWNLPDGQPLDFRLGLSPAASRAALDPETGVVLCGGAPATLWRFPVQREKWALPATRGSQVAAFFGDDHLFAPAERSWTGLYQLGDELQPSAQWIGSTTLRFSVAISADHRVGCVDIGTVPSRSKLQLFFREGDGSVRQGKPLDLDLPLRHLALDATGNRLLTVHAYRMIRVFEVGQTTPRVTIPVKGAKQIKAARFADADRRILALASTPRDTGESEDWLLAWDSQSGAFAYGITNRHHLVALAVTADGRRVAIAGGSKEIAIHNARDLAPVLRFRAHDALITALAFHPTLPILASCSEDFSVKLWDWETGRLLDTFLGPTRRPGALSFSASGHLLACNSADNVTRVWEIDGRRFQDQQAPLSASK